MNHTLKTRWSYVCQLSSAAGVLALLSGCVVRPYGRVDFAAPVVTVAPEVEVAPAVEVEPVMVPESYTWDGVEYVGLVGDRYYYLGAGNVWLVAGPDRLAYFHGWERSHSDWRSHATHNNRYRKEVRGHNQPKRQDHR